MRSYLILMALVYGAGLLFWIFVWWLLEVAA